MATSALEKGTAIHAALARKYEAMKPKVGTWVEVLSYPDDDWNEHRDDDPITVKGGVGQIVKIHSKSPGARDSETPQTYSVLLTLVDGRRWEDVVFADEVRILQGGELEALAIITKNQKLLEERS